MKTKSFVMLAIAGLVSASLAYVAPVMAEESSDLPMEQTLADNSNTSMQTPSDIQTPSDNSMQTPNSNAPTENIGSTNTSNSTTDEASPDTATGDDDY